MKGKPITARVEVPGVASAAFKLVEKAPDSYDLFRSSRKLGTARVEDDGLFTARFESGKTSWTASADGAGSLLKLVGTFLLAREARGAAARPIEETDPALRVQGRKSDEQKLSLKLLGLAQTRRLAELDKQIKALGRSIKRAAR